MTHRERFRTVLHRQVPDRLPLVARLDLWHNAAVHDGTLPPECRGLTIPQIEKRLGMGRSARFTHYAKPIFPAAETTETRDDRTILTLRAGGRELRQVSLTTPEDRAAGMFSHVTEYLLKSAEDYETMRQFWESARWEFRREEFQRLCDEVGDDGLPVIFLGDCGAHEIMLRYAGYENFYLHRSDLPSQVEALIQVMDQRLEETWTELAASPAELILHGTHWSTDMTPRPIFREWFLPYFRRFTAAMHAAGKQCGFHADSDLSGLLPEVLESGMDVADCFACDPLVRLKLRDARAAWGDRVVLWGGIPSTLLAPSAPLEEFRAYMDRFEREVSDGRAVIASVSDNLMPGSDWGRMVEVAERIAGLKIARAGNEETAE